MSAPIKLYLLTGFLGSGKTTFLQKSIDYLSGSKVGILMNEFGKLSIDGLVLQKHGLDIVEINNGSVFCSCLKGAFIDALIAYSELPIDYLFVESSGMADPSSIKQIVDDVIGKVKGKKYDYGGAICIVDSLNFLDQVDVLAPIERQIASSDLIIVNKVDLADKTILAAVREKIACFNPAAEVLQTVHSSVDLSFLSQGLKKSQGNSGPAQCCNTPANRPAAHILTAKGVFDKEKFINFISALVPSALRMKGFFLLSDGWQQIDVVGSQIDIKPTEISCTVSQLVVISDKGLPALNQIYLNWDERFTEELEVG
ncbi:MAG: GTP-binding protein [Pelosinus sp.]|nr:GTP-binding protein [Pelosinus sp.]